MQGVSFIVDDKGAKKAAVIDVKMHGELLEDLLDIIVCKKRKSEPSISLATMRKRVSAKKR